MRAILVGLRFVIGLPMSAIAIGIALVATVAGALLIFLDKFADFMIDIGKSKSGEPVFVTIGILLWACIFAAFTGCGPSAGPPPNDAPAVTLTPQPWCMDVDHVQDTRVTVLHMGVHAEGRSAFRFDVLTGDEAHVLPGRYLEPSDGHIKVRIEEDATSQPWDAVTVVVYTARGDRWDRTDSRGNMPRCSP